MPVSLANIIEGEIARLETVSGFSEAKAREIIQLKEPTLYREMLANTNEHERLEARQRALYNLNAPLRESSSREFGGKVESLINERHISFDAAWQLAKQKYPDLWEKSNRGHAKLERETRRERFSRR
jgi:hypothetical protein